MTSPDDCMGDDAPFCHFGSERSGVVVLWLRLSTGLQKAHRLNAAVNATSGVHRRSSERCQEIVMSLCHES